MFARQVEVGLRGHAVALEYGLHLLVGKAAVALDHRVCQVPVLYLALVVDVEYGRVSQFLLIGSQRAYKVAQALGQHGYGAVDEVDTGGTLHGLLVNDVALLHIVRHISNVHTHLPQALLQLAY